MTSKSAHWQAAFRSRRREAGLKALTVWMPKEDVDRLARYPERERGEVITRALALLESQGEFRGDDATLTGEGAITVTETPPLPVAELTATQPVITPPEHPAKLPPERIAALRRRAKTCGLSWGEIAQRFNAEGVPTLSGQGQWHESTVAKLVANR